MELYIINKDEKFKTILDIYSHSLTHYGKVQKYNKAKYVGLQFFDMWC